MPVMHMIITEEVQNAMHQKLIESLFCCQVGLTPLSGAGIHGDDHITQKVGIDITMFTFAHGKGNDIRGPLMMQIGLIEHCDAHVIHKDHGEFGVRRAQGV